MNDNAITPTSVDAGTLETVLVGGDLSKLTAAQRVSYYKAVCESVGLNPLTKPFAYIILNGKLTLYALRDATDQLREIKQISITPVSKTLDPEMGIYSVQVEARTPNGRKDFATGVVSIANLKGADLANAFMKAETKAKRRGTLSICGLGWMDEAELDTVPNAKRVNVTETGEIVDGEVKPAAQPPAKPAQPTTQEAINTLMGESSIATLYAPREYLTKPIPVEEAAMVELKHGGEIIPMGTLTDEQLAKVVEHFKNVHRMLSDVEIVQRKAAETLLKPEAK